MVNKGCEDDEKTKGREERGISWGCDNSVIGEAPAGIGRPVLIGHGTVRDLPKAKLLARDSLESNANLQYSEQWP